MEKSWEVTNLKCEFYTTGKVMEICLGHGQVMEFQICPTIVSTRLLKSKETLWQASKF